MKSSVRSFRSIVFKERAKSLDKNKEKKISNILSISSKVLFLKDLLQLYYSLWRCAICGMRCVTAEVRQRQLETTNMYDTLMRTE